MSQYSLVQIQPYSFLFELQLLREVISFPNLSPIPQAPIYIRGVFPLRGSICTLLCLSSLMGFERKKQENTLVVIIGHPLGQFGIETSNVDICSFSAPPHLPPSNLPFLEWVQGVYPLQNNEHKEAFLLNLDPLASKLL